MNSIQNNIVLHVRMGIIATIPKKITFQPHKRLIFATAKGDDTFSTLYIIKSHVESAFIKQRQINTNYMKQIHDINKKVID